MNIMCICTKKKKPTTRLQIKKDGKSIKYQLNPLTNASNYPLDDTFTIINNKSCLNKLFKYELNNEHSVFTALTTKVSSDKLEDVSKC